MGRWTKEKKAQIEGQGEKKANPIIEVPLQVKPEAETEPPRERPGKTKREIFDMIFRCQCGTCTKGFKTNKTEKCFKCGQDAVPFLVAEGETFVNVEKQ